MRPGAVERRTPSAERRDRFEQLYNGHYAVIMAYARRRTADRDHAYDVVAETFLIAWRRLDEVPAGASALLWLYGVARRVLSNQERSVRRQERLAARLAGHATGVAAAADVDVPGGAVALAWGRLRPDDRDLLLLVAVEGLGPSEIARVVGARTATVRVRLHRSRARFAHELRAAGLDL